MPSWSSLGLCAGQVLVTAGRLWLAWLLSLGFAFCYALLALLLVPRYGAVGYAASLALAYATAWTLPSLIVLYRSYPETMRYARWGLLALTTLSLFAFCILISILFTFPWTVGLGTIAALVFITFVLRSFPETSGPTR